MAVFLLILQNIIFPVFSLMLAGVILQRKFILDLNTLSKITFYYLIPVVIFVKIYQAPISLQLLSEILLFLLLQTLLLLAVTSLIAKVVKFEMSFAASFKNSVILNNQGNFGLPLNALVFKNDPFAMSIQIIVMTFQNLLTFTYGLFNVQQREKSREMFQSFQLFFKTPVLHALIIAVVFKLFKIKIPEMLWLPLEQAAQGFLAIALLTLGAQVAYLKFNANLLAIILTAVARLIIAPLLAYFVIQTLQIDGITAQALFIASSYPTSRNSAAIALEYKHYPDYAAQAVLLTTIASAVTVTVIVYLAVILF